MVVTGQYAPPEMTGVVASWVIGIGLTGALPSSGTDCLPLPAWPLRFVAAESGYSPKLTIEAPDDVTVTLILPEGG